MKVLIVEDDPHSQTYFKETIKGLGHEVFLAANGKIGLQQFREVSPDLVFSDIRMPEMDGLTLLKEIRRLNQDVIVIINTAFGCEEYTMQALRLQANDYVRKPVRLDELTSLISKYAMFIENRSLENEVLGLIVYRDCIVKFPNRLDLIGKIIDRLILETGNALKREERLGVHLGLGELLMNAFEHGSLAISYEEKGKALAFGIKGLDNLYKTRMRQPEFAARLVTVEFYMNQEYCQWIIEDEGEGFDWKSIPDPLIQENLGAQHGRGIFLSRMQFDELEFLGKGNRVRVRKSIITKA